MAKVKYLLESEVVFSEQPKDSRFIDLTGQIFGRLTVIGYAGQTESKDSTWFCRCKCEKLTRVHGTALKSGNTTSCGCMKIEILKERRITHGQSGGQRTPEYNTWKAIRGRTQNPNNKRFSDYGGRGITVCARWQKFENFFADMGVRPEGKSLDRIENDGNYCPENCRWATRVEQNNNKRNSHKFAYAGKAQNINQWANEMGMPAKALGKRLNKYGWPIEKALTTPLKINNNVKFSVDGN